MAKLKAPMSVEKKQLRWIKRHKVGVGSFVRIIRVPSEDELKDFPDFDMDRIRQFQGTHNWVCIHLIGERAMDEADGDNGDVLALYPVGWEEYSGVAKLGRFSFVSDDEDVAREIFTLRHFLKRALRCSDKALGDEAVLLDENVGDADILDDYVVNLARF